MDEEKIIIKINDKGEITAEARGIKGPTCIDELQRLLEDIAEIHEVHKTDEYYMTPGGVHKTTSNIKRRIRK